jgi:hypothetical protein
MVGIESFLPRTSNKVLAFEQGWFVMSRSTQSEEHQRLIRQYRSEGNQWPATARQIAEWAIENGLMAPHPNAFINQCSELLSRAMREEYYTDPQGRRVRAKHVAKMMKNGQQMALWDDHQTASLQHMLNSSQLRRQQIVGDCHQLRIDVDSYNENAKPSTPIEIIFDFTYDLAELDYIENGSDATLA